MTRSPQETVARSGFSLVEVAMALLVVSIGVLGAFGLFPTGIQSGKASLDETRAILFAEETFNSFRALALNRAWDTLPAGRPSIYGNRLWRDPWDASAPDSFLAPRITPTVRLNKYISSTAAIRYTQTPDPNDGIEEFALRYVLERVYIQPGNPNSAPPADSMRIGLRLWVWSGEFGLPEPTATPSATHKANAFYFYTEIYNFQGPEEDPDVGPEVVGT